MIILGYQTSNSASSSKFHHLAKLALLVALVSHSSNFHHWPLLALLVALVLHQGDSVDFIFAILYMIIGSVRMSRQETLPGIVLNTLKNAWEILNLLLGEFSIW